MQNRIKTLEFKRKCLEFHYSQAANAANALTPDRFHVCVSEFAAMMEVMHTCIEIALLSTKGISSLYDESKRFG
ncbi:hypothetical protein [Paenibacillus sp. EPM92]|uniref:hypothetical protein n=1 Tax=Paenibacillus sp. EPM92 TaxID=1561195 RepID=UPI001916942B|nr:hypothetical protein [Paenibacillus sp. EPM92]